MTFYVSGQIALEFVWLIKLVKISAPIVTYIYIGFAPIRTTHPKEMENAQLFEELVAEEEGGDDTMELMSLNGLNKTALGHLLKRIREELATLPEAQGMMFQPQANFNEPTTATSMPERNMGNYCADIIERCDEKPLWNALMGYGFLIVFCFALIGNCLNLLIYKSDHIRFFIAIRMLCTKLLMNTLMMVVMLPQALRVIRLWDIGGPTDQLYWRFWPYQAYLTNVFGFCAMWLTVLMTAECYIHIFFPSKSKLLCTKQTVWRSYAIILMAGLMLASIYPLNRDVSLIDRCDRKIVKIITSQTPLMIFFEKFHTIADMFLSILLPLSLLVFMTAMIVWRLWIWPNRRWRRLQAKGKKAAVQQNGREGGGGTMAMNGLLSTAAYQERNKRENHFAAEKRGVTRITLITCFIQLVTETPSMSVLIYVSMFGPNVHKKEHICMWQTISYFLCLCNASLSFFVYITFSTRFRKTMINRAHRLLHQLCPSVFAEVASSSVGVKHSQHRLPNSSATHSQMILMTSKENSPRNGSQSEGKHPKLLIVSQSEPMGGGRSRSTTALKDLDSDPQSPPAVMPKLSSQNTPINLDQQFTNFSLAKRFLQQKLQQNGKAKGPLRKIESDSMTETTTNSQETIVAQSISGHPEVQQNNSSDSSNCRPLSNSMNGRIMGAGRGGAENGGGSLKRKQSGGMATKRSSVCSTMTNNNSSQFDAFL